MTQDEFWEHIRATRRRDPEEHAERLAARLAELPVEEILAFGRWWWVLRCEARTPELWGAAVLINGGCSDDGFEYFRNWLLLRGREVYEAAVADPDALADHLHGDGEVESEDVPSYDAYCAATEKEDYLEALKAAYPDLPAPPAADAEWDFDDEAEMRRRYPKLFAAYAAEDE